MLQIFINNNINIKDIFIKLKFNKLNWSIKTF